MRELALFGYWGREVGITDGHHRYLRGSGGSNFPLSMWSNRWSTMPVPAYPEIRLLPGPTGGPNRETMPGTEVPVIRQPFEAGDPLPFWAAMGPRMGHVCSTWTPIPARSRIKWVDGERASSPMPWRENFAVFTLQPTF